MYCGLIPNLNFSLNPTHSSGDSNLKQQFQIQRLSLSPYKLLIPLVVLEEISGLCKSSEKGNRAASALDVVNRLISEKSVSLLTSKVSLRCRQQAYL